MSNWKTIGIGLLFVLLLPHVASRAQQMVNSGHALDANLRIGSGGYNSARGGGGGAYRIRGARRGFGVNEGATGERGFHGGRGGFGAPGFRRGVYRPHNGGIDRYNAFLDERAYSPLRGTGSDMRHHVQGTGRQVAPTTTAARAPRQVAGARRPAAGFGETYDSGYEASLADSTYESATAQRQANALSYGIGFALGQEVVAALEQDKVTADMPSVIMGFSEALKDDPPRMSEAELEALLQALFERVLGDRIEADPALQTELQRNVATGDALRARFARDPEVVTLGNGLQNKVIEAGTGPAPGADDTVSVEYRRLTSEGAYLTERIQKRVDLPSMVEGVRMALTAMKVGGVRRVAVPPHLAHGESGRPPFYGPGETVFFEVKLLAIE